MNIRRVETVGKAGPRIAYAADAPTMPEDPPAREEDSFPEFPLLTGPLDDLVRGITPDLPYQHKALSTIVLVGAKLSGRAQLASDPHLQPRFYGITVGPPFTGKSASDKEVCRALAPILGDIHREYSFDSGPALVEALAEFPRLVYAPDEMADAFEKARHTPGGHNSLFGEFLRLYDSNTTGRRVLKKNGPLLTLNDVHFSMIGSATPERFDRMWSGTSGASGGLQSRFVLSFSDTPMPPTRTPNRDDVIETAVAALKENLFDAYIRLSGDAQDAIVEWAHRVDTTVSPRALDMAKRFSLVLAVSRRMNEIDGETMNRGLKFADYQLAVHAKLMPADAYGWVQGFENKIISYLGRHDQASERDLRRAISPERHPGGYGSFQQACRNLVTTEKLVLVGKNSKDKPIWGLD